MTLDLAKSPIFPCKADKKPLTPNGFYDARVGADYSRWPLVGLATGAVSDIDVLDVDPMGLAWLAENEHRLPATRRHRTRRGGVHLLFRHAEGLRKSESRIAPEVDVRADGSYAIYWPRQGLPMIDAPIAPWPDWLLVLAQGRVRVRTRSRDGAMRDGSISIVPTHLCARVCGDGDGLWSPTLNPPKRIKAIMQTLENAPKGERNGWLFRSACSLAEIVAEGHLNVVAARKLLESGCHLNGLWRDPDDGPERCRATIASAFHRVEQKLLRVGDAGNAQAQGSE